MSDLLPVLTHDPGGRSKPAWRAGSHVTARWAGLKDCYRLELVETWDESLPALMWQMMNPSVAGIAHSDPTLMRTGDFARRWGFGAQMIGNDHAYRATDKRALLGVGDPVGPGNDEAILSMAQRCAIIVLAQGQPPRPLRARSSRVIAMLREAGHGHKMHYLRLSKDGTPWHPLYISGDTEPQRWQDA